MIKKLRKTYGSNPTARIVLICAELDEWNSITKTARMVAVTRIRDARTANFVAQFATEKEAVDFINGSDHLRLPDVQILLLTIAINFPRCTLRVDRASSARAIYNVEGDEIKVQVSITATTGRVLADHVNNWKPTGPHPIDATIPVNDEELYALIAKLQEI